MSNEKKNEVTEEVKEARKLTEEELAQVTGGETVYSKSVGEVFYTGGLYLAHVKATGEIRAFTNRDEAESYLTVGS